MRYFKMTGERLVDGEPEEIFTTGQLRVEGPVDALKFFADIFKTSGTRKSVERVFAQGGYLVLRENKS